MTHLRVELSSNRSHQRQSLPPKLLAAAIFTSFDQDGLSRKTDSHSKKMNRREQIVGGRNVMIA